MTRWAIVGVYFPQGAIEAEAFEVCPIVGGNSTVPELGRPREVVSRVEMIDRMTDGEAWVLRESGGQCLPPDRTRVHVTASGHEYVRSIRDGRDSDALRDLRKIPKP